MARQKGSLSLASNIEPSMNAPLDARLVVNTVADLTASGSFPYFYVGMTVAVKADNKSYKLIGNDPTVSANWVKTAPEKTSELTNDSGFIANTVNNLVNYYLKSETYTKAEVEALIGAVTGMHFEAVNELPTTDISTNAIYLVPNATQASQNVKDEYINLDGTTAGWELIGSTQIDLTGYVTINDLNTALADYVTSTSLATTLGGYIAKSQTAGLVKNDGTIDTNTYLTQHQDISGKADKVTNAVAGDLATLNASGNPTDSGIASANLVQKSQTAGLLKNDGTVDESTYLKSIPTASANTLGGVKPFL